MTQAVTELIVDGSGALRVLDEYERGMADAARSTQQTTGAVDGFNTAMSRFIVAQEKGLAITTQKVDRLSREQRAFENWQAAIDRGTGLEIKLRRESQRAAVDAANAVALGYTTQEQALKTLLALEAKHAAQLAEVRNVGRTAVAATNEVAQASRRLAVANDNARFATANLAAQFQDIAVTSAMGMSPLQIALQQGTQISAVLGPMGAAGAVRGLGAAFLSIINPVSLVTIGLVAAAAAAVQYFMTADDGAVKIEEQLRKQEDLIRAVASRWGDAAPALKAYADELERARESQERYAAATAAAEMKIKSLKGEMDGLLGTIDRMDADYILSNAINSADIEQVRAFRESMLGVKEAIEDGRDPTFKLNDAIAALSSIFQDNAAPAVRELLDNLTEVAKKMREVANEAKAITSLPQLSPLWSENGKILTPDDFVPRVPAVPSSRPLIELDGLPGADKQEKQLKKLAESYKDLILAGKQRIDQMRLELELAGKSGAAAEALRFEQDLLAQTMEKLGKITPDQRREIHGLAQEYGQLAQALEEARVKSDLLFEREQMSRSPVEQRVASQMRELYGDDYQSHMSDAIAGQIRLNDQWRTAQDELKAIGDVGTDALGGLLDILYQSGDAAEQLLSLFAGIGKQFAKMGLDRMIGNVKSGKSIFDLSVLGFSTAGNVDTKATAITIGREIGSAVAPTVTVGFKSGIDTWAAAIRKIESGSYAGNYGAVGPITRGGDRAYGAYQVMGANISTWTREVLGQSLSIKEFLSDRAAQDKVFYTKFSQSADKFGSMADATSVWFSGRPISRAGNASDGYNTVPQYVSKVQSAADAYPGGLRQGVSDGVVDANRRVQQNATMQGMGSPAATGQMGKLEALLGLGGAAFGAFAGGYQSGSPLMGGLSGAMSGFGAAPALSALGLGSAAGPIGIIGGAILGVIGGIFGKRRQKKQEKEQARAELESQRGAIQSLIDAAMGTPSGDFESSWRQMSDEIAKARKLASKAGDSALVKELDLASETFFNFLVDDWKRGLDGVMKAMEAGHGMDGAFVRAQKAITDLQDTLVGFVEDAKFFAETGGDYEKAKLGKKVDDNVYTGVPPDWYTEMQREQGVIPDAYRVAVERYKDKLKELDINAILTDGTGRDQREIAAFATVDDLMKKMEDLGVVFDDLGNILTADQVKERLEREKELARAVEDAQKAAQKMALRQLTGAKEFTAIEEAIQTLEGTAAGLQTTLEKLGMTTDEATKAIEDGLAKAMDKLRKDYVKDLNRSINELSGKGYINDFLDAQKMYKERLKDTKALGIDSSLALKEFALTLSAIASESDLSAAELEKYAKKLGIPFEVITGAVKDLDKVNAKKWQSTFADLNTRFMQASVNTEELAGQLKLFDRQARLERERLVEAGATTKVLTLLEATLYAERRKLIEDFYKQEINTAKSAVDEALDALRTFADGIRDFRDTIRLDGNLSTLSPADKLAEARRQYETTLAAANKGDRDAMSKLTSVSQSYLDQAKDFYASSEAYADIFKSVDSALALAGTKAQGQITAAERQIDLLARQVSSLATVNDSVLSVAQLMAKLNDTVSAYFKAGGRGFASGGYTGDLGVNQVAGVTHGREFVMDAATTARYRPQLEAMHAGTYRAPVIVAPAGNDNSQAIRELTQTVAAAGNAQIAAIREEMEELREAFKDLTREVGRSSGPIKTRGTGKAA